MYTFHLLPTFWFSTLEAINKGLHILPCRGVLVLLETFFADPLLVTSGGASYRAVFHLLQNMEVIPKKGLKLVGSSI